MCSKCRLAVSRSVFHYLCDQHKKHKNERYSSVPTVATLVQFSAVVVPANMSISSNLAQSSAQVNSVETSIMADSAVAMEESNKSDSLNDATAKATRNKRKKHNKRAKATTTKKKKDNPSNVMESSTRAKATTTKQKEKKKDNPSDVMEATIAGDGNIDEETETDDDKE